MLAYCGGAYCGAIGVGGGAGGAKTAIGSGATGASEVTIIGGTGMFLTGLHLVTLRPLILVVVHSFVVVAGPRAAALRLADFLTVAASA